jgi:hypothetical protein
MHKYHICKKIANWFGEFFGIHIIMLIYTDIFVKKIREVQVKKYEIENIERDKKIGPL